MPKHKKNAEVGEKKTVYSSNILVEQEDAQSFEDNEEVSQNVLLPSANIEDGCVVDSHGLGKCHRQVKAS